MTNETALDNLKLAIREAVEEIKNVGIVTAAIDSELAAIKAEVRESARLEMIEIMKARGIDPSEYNELMNGVASSSSKPNGPNRQFLVFEHGGKTYGVYRGKGKATGILADAIEAGQTLDTMKAKGRELKEPIKSKLKAASKQFIDITDML